MQLRIYFFILFVTSYYPTVFAQKISGALYDSITHQPVAFAYLTLDDHRTGTATDIDGKYILNLSQGYTGNVTISHISYQTRVIAAASLARTPHRILTAARNQLQEFVFKAGENPAWGIIRKVVANRQKHDPKNLDTYQYTAYNKVTAALLGKALNIDSLLLLATVNEKPLNKQQREMIEMENLAEKQHVFMSESVTEEKFKAPNKNFEKLLTYKISGFNSPLFASLPTDYQPFGLYDEQIKIVAQDYLNPVSKNSWNKYDFELTDTLYNESDSIYVISYEPLKGSTFNSLKGQLSISTRGYAIKNIIAESTDRFAKIGFRVQQNYELVNDRWFPSQLNTDLFFREYKFNHRALTMQVRSYLSSISINIPMEAKTFEGVGVELTATPDSVLLNKSRTVPLENKDLLTYTFYDSVSSSMKALKIIDHAIEGLANGVIPVGQMDVDLSRLFKFNRYERGRIGIGLQTGPSFSQRVRTGAWAGYGIKDERLKYGGFFQLNINQAKQMYVRASYANTITEQGAQHFFEEIPRISSLVLRDWAASRFDRTESFTLKAGSRVFRNWNVHVSGIRTSIHPIFPYSLIKGGEENYAFQLSEAALEINYAAKQKTYSMNGRYAMNGFQFPIVSLRMTQALPDVVQSDHFTYTRYDVLLADRWKHRRLGVTSVTFCAGFQEGIAPLSKMYFGRGVKQSTYEVEGFFQTMDIYEFVADNYVNLFVKQNVGNVFYNIKYSKPELMLSQGVGYGIIRNQVNRDADKHLFSSYEKGYFESGVTLRNLIRFNYFNVAFIGFGAGVYYRYGYYQLPDAIDNFKLKMDLSISF
ncbi:MAG: hypothetical protein DI538_10050 [Azospira oryzae]|nr:MAG: hypothetical protein DI538_10050 [Azospira oryzae]